MNVIYDSIIDAVQEFDLPTRGEVYVAVIEYLRYKRIPDLDAMSPIARALFLAQKPTLDVQIAKSEAGRRGGRPAKDGQKQTESKPKAEPKATGKQSESKPKAEGKANGKQNESEKEKEKEIEETTANAVAKKSGAPRFKPPTAAEVDAYIAQMGYAGFTGQQLVDHYEANGWMRGKTPIRDWRACVRTWANQRGRGRASPQATIADYSAYDDLMAG